MSSSLLLTNGKCFIQGKLVDAALHIEAGKIKSIVQQEDFPKADRTIDLQGKYVLPGIIDAHVHFRDPGLTHKEDFFSGSKAAVVGGVTTILDMPNTNPPTFTADLLEEKKKLAREKCITNWGLYFGTNAKNEKEIQSANNIAAVKVYMNTTTGNLLIENDDDLKKLFQLPQKFALHAEGETFQKALNFLLPTGNLAYLCHASLQYEVDLVRQYKSEGKNVYMEVCPHHLFMTDKEREIHGAYCCMKPPLATQADQDALWEGLRDGIIDTISTDHAPHTREEKDSDKIMYGVPGVQHSLPLMLNGVNQGKISLARMVACMSENPATIFGMQGKGSIEEGKDADLVIVDMNKESEIRNEDVVSRCGWTPYHGWKVKGWPVVTIVNGKVVCEDGEVDERVRGEEIIFK